MAVDNFYWELTLMSKDKVLIPPEHVLTVQRKMDAGENIKTSRQTIPAHQITSFERTGKRKTNQPNLLEEAAMAFGEPLVRERAFKDGTTDEAVSARWVKKEVTAREWERYYSPHGYKRLDTADGMVIVAFVAATHLIDTNKLEYCTAEEIQQLTK